MARLRLEMQKVIQGFVGRDFSICSAAPTDEVDVKIDIEIAAKKIAIARRQFPE